MYACIYLYVCVYVWSRKQYKHKCVIYKLIFWRTLLTYPQGLKLKNLMCSRERSAESFLAYSHSYLISKSLEIVQVIIKTFNLYALTNKCRSIATLEDSVSKATRKLMLLLGYNHMTFNFVFKPCAHCAGRPAYIFKLLLSSVSTPRLLITECQ